MIEQIISELTDEELAVSLKHFLEECKGIMPENVRLMAMEMLRRWQGEQAS